jgi:hypothetical protein
MAAPAALLDSRIVLPIVTLNVCRCNVEHASGIYENLFDICPHGICCFQEVTSWPAGTEFEVKFCESVSVVRATECPSGSSCSTKLGYESYLAGLSQPLCTDHS